MLSYHILKSFPCVRALAVGGCNMKNTLLQASLPLTKQMQQKSNHLTEEHEFALLSNYLFSAFKLATFNSSSVL